MTYFCATPFFVCLFKTNSKSRVSVDQIFKPCLFVALYIIWKIIPHKNSFLPKVETPMCEEHKNSYLVFFCYVADVFGGKNPFKSLMHQG